MSGYATVAELAIYGVPAASLASFTDPEKLNALDAASATADSYLSAAFRLPLTAWDTSITKAVCQIAACDLLRARGYNPASGGDPAIQAAHDSAMAWLRDISQGRARPSGCTETPPPASSVSKVVSAAKRGW